MRCIRLVCQAFVVCALLCVGSLAAQNLDVYGGSTSLQCGPNTKAVTSSIVSVSRNAGMVTLTFSAAHRFIVYDVLSVSGTAADGGRFNSPSQTLFTVLSVPSSTTVTYNQAGDNVPTTANSGTAELGRFYTSKVNSRWWVCTPLGNVMFVNEMYDATRQDVIDYENIDTRQVVQAKYAKGISSTNPTDNWAYQTAHRLKAWGFNGLGEYSDGHVYPANVDSGWPATDHTMPVDGRLPFVVEPNPVMYSTYNNGNLAPGPTKAQLELFKRSVFNMTGVRNEADVLDPNFSAWLMATLTGKTQIHQWLTAPHHEYMWSWTGDESDVAGGFLLGPYFQGEKGGGTNDPNTVVLLNGYTAMDVHWGYMTLISSPIAAAASMANTAAGRSPNDWVFGDMTYHVKAELEKYVQQSADRGPGYATISALNAAWGSNYDSFGSDAVSHTDSCEVGNGTPGPYTCTLTNLPVTPLSVQFKSGNAGALLAGDDGAGPELRVPTQIGNMRYTGGTKSIGTINYATGVVTVTFASAIPSGAPIEVVYSTNGWGQGHGLLDEDGTCPSKPAGKACWVPTNPFWKSTGTETQLQKDLDGFLFHFAKLYFSIVKGDFNSVFPGYLYNPINPIGAYSDPPRPEILEAAGMYADILSFSSLPPTDPTGSVVKDGQARIDFVAQYAGDLPWLDDSFFVAQADSYFPAAQFPLAQALTFFTQSARGQYYQTKSQGLLDATISAACNCSFAGTNPVIGQGWWELYDDASTKTDFGLITDRDDPYDGVASTPNPGIDQWGYPTGCLGADALPGPTTPCEQASYGDVLTGVAAGNTLWLQLAK